MSEEKTVILSDRLIGTHIELLVVAPDSGSAEFAGWSRVRHYGTKVLGVARLEHRQPFKNDVDNPTPLAKRVAKVPDAPLFRVRCGTPKGLQRTVGVMKPGAKARLGWDDVKCLVPGLLHDEQQVWDRAKAELFYAEHQGKPFFNGLIDHAVSGPCQAFVMEAVDIVKSWRLLIGPTDPKAAGDGFRQLHGTELPDNGWHGSASVEEAAREAVLVLPRWA